MSGANYPITGVPKPSPAPADGSVSLRLEVRELQQNADQWNLFLLGLNAFQNSGETGDLSYYGIAGIHGRPYRPWGGVQGQNPGGGWQGYCTHTSILFAPWHRPYLALYEQVLYGVIQDIASQFPDDSKARYQAAAASFRIPYWDWAANPSDGGYFPNSVGQSTTVQVITPTSNGQPVSIANPLYSYKFHPINPVPGDFVAVDRTPYNKWPATLRYPSSPSALNAVSEEDQLFQAMATQFAGLQQNINILLNDPNYQDFAAFSNHAWQNNEPSTYASLEDVHNSIHSMVGGNMGHMSELDYSAFDPVFWLHHTNVDRIFAIWQALNPTSYTIDEDSGDGTYVIQAGTTETSQTPLAPFADTTGAEYWTSEGVRSTLTFNYAYPETQAWSFTSTNDYQNSVANAVQQLYGGLSGQVTGDDNPVNFMATPSNIPAPVEEKAVAQQAIPAPVQAEAAAPKEHGFHPFHDLASKFKEAISHKDTDGERGLDLESEIGKPDPHAPAPKAGSYTEYIVNIKAPKHILGQSYRVHVFLGEFTPELKTWHTQDALVGTFAVFGKDTTSGTESETGCGKCKKDAADNVLITGTVPLTSQIIQEIKKGNCPSLDKDNVLPYLTKNLHWRVTLADGQEKSRDEVPGLVLSVVTTEVSLPVGGRPQYSGVYQVHPEVTTGRPAGYSGPATQAGPH